MSPCTERDIDGSSDKWLWPDLHETEPTFLLLDSIASTAVVVATYVEKSWVAHQVDYPLAYSGWTPGLRWFRVGEYRDIMVEGAYHA